MTVISIPNPAVVEINPIWLAKINPAKEAHTLEITKDKTLNLFTGIPINIDPSSLSPMAAKYLPDLLLDKYR